MPAISQGTSESWIAQLSWVRDSWTAPLDVRRLHPVEDLGQITATQIRTLVTRLGGTGSVPLFFFAAGYDQIALTVDLAALPVALLVRIRGDRIFYTDPATRGAGQMGR